MNASVLEVVRRQITREEQFTLSFCSKFNKSYTILLEMSIFILLHICCSVF